MTKTEYIDRYVYAVTKRMTSSQKDDVAEELRTLIEDMLAQRCGDVTPTEKDVKIILTELGTPSELAAKYATDEKNCLIGQPYFSTYKLVLKIVLICTVIGMTIAGVISQITTPPDFVWINVVVAMIVEVITMVFSGLMSAFATVTLLFAIFYHFNVDLGTDKIEDLPPVPKKSETISKGECIFGISLSIIFLSVFLFAPEVFSVIHEKQITPIFNVDVVKATWYFVVAFGLLGVFREVIKLMEGRYTKKVLITTVVTDVLTGVVSAFWLLNDKIMNPAFSQSVLDIFANESEYLMRIFTNFQYFFLGLILLSLAADMLETAIKTVRAK